MSIRKEDAAVRSSIVVEAPIERAFRVFTHQFGSFKPPEHNMLAVEIVETIFEPRVGGYVFDRGVDGSECRWARVLVYQPPHRVVITWDIAPDWRIETDLEKTSEVEVCFIPEGPDRTRVELEHRNLDRHGVGWEAERDGVGGDEGWPLYMGRFAKVVGPADKLRAAHRRLVRRVLDGDGRAPQPSRQRAYDNAEPVEPVRTLINKVATKPSQVTDRDIDLVKAAGCGEDEIFELVICAAIGQATRQYEVGLAALDEAAADRGVSNAS